MVCIYVDEMIYFGSSKSLVNEFKFNMIRNFDMSYFGLLKYFLGFKVIQDKDGIFISKKN